MNKDSLHEEMSIFTEKFSYEYIEGITEEIKEIFFRSQTEGEKQVRSFAVFFDHETNHYRVAVTLAEYNFPTARSIFLSFFTFIAYTGANITFSKQTEQGISYALASFDEQGRGFYCEVDFFPKEVKIQEEEQRNNLLTAGELPSNQKQQPEVKWKFKVDSTDNFPLLADQNTIYSVGDEGDLYAVDVDQGILRWYWKAERQRTRIVTLPSIDRGFLSVYTSTRSQIGIYETFLYTLDAQTGQILSSYPVPAIQSIGACNLLTVQGGVAYLSGTDRNASPVSLQCRCFAIDLQTGHQKWSFDLGKKLGTTTPAISNAKMYVVTFDMLYGHLSLGHLHSLDIQTGAEIWKHTFETHGVQELIVDGTDIIIAGTNLEVVDAVTGAIKGSLSDLQVFRDSPFVVDDELIYISSEHTPDSAAQLEANKPHEVLLAGGPPRLGRITAIDRTSRQPRWIKNLTYGYGSPEKLAIAGEVLYTTWRHLDIRGDVTHATLFALDVHNGREIWRFEADDMSAPSAINDVVFVHVREEQGEYIYALS